MTIKQLTDATLDEAIALSLHVFTTCGTADFDANGLQTFKSFIYDSTLMHALTLFGAFNEDQLIGILGTKNGGTHISLFFILPEFQHKGIGQRLFLAAYAAKNELEITVNSSSYAVPFYKRLGFLPLCEEQETNGLRYTPMKRMKKQ